MAIFLNLLFILINTKISLPFILTTRFYSNPERFFPALFWVVYIMKQYICFLFQIQNYILAILFKPQNLWHFLFQNRCSWFFSGKKKQAVICYLWLLFFPFLLFPSPFSFSPWTINSALQPLGGAEHSKQGVSSPGGAAWCRMRVSSYGADGAVSCATWEPK